MLCKGAPEVVLGLIGDRAGQRAAAQRAVDELTDAGLRVLAVAQAALLASIVHERDGALAALRDELRALDVHLRDAA